MADFKIKDLELVDFRKFHDASIGFDPKLTVLVADNGVGKTTVLDALRIALSPIVKAFGDDPRIGISSDDIRKIHGEGGGRSVWAEKAEVKVGLEWDGRLFSWTRSKASGSGHRTKRKDAGLRQAVSYVSAVREELRKSVSDSSPDAPTLPLVAFYGTGRLWNSTKVTPVRRRHARDMTIPESAYADCLSTSANYELFKVWFEAAVNESQREKATGIPSPHHPHDLLDAVQSAIKAVLHSPMGIRMLYWDFLERRMVAIHEDGETLPVDSLSDGVRSVLAMVADLAHRAVRLNPHLGPDACRNTPGVVMIDEVDLHLHPRWQQTVVDSLLDAFPMVQFILTTHSPQVLSSVRGSQIRAVSDGGAMCIPAFQTRGVESPFILAQVMGVDPVPTVEQAKWVQDYLNLVDADAGESDEAQRLRSLIVAHFGESHPVMDDCRRYEALARVRRMRRNGGD